MNHSAWPAPRGTGPSDDRTPEQLLEQVARGSEAAFERLYAVVSGPVFGMVRQVVRDVAQSEEVTQEVLVELWRTAARYDPAKGSAMTWTLAHRRAVDRVRSAQARADREQRVGATSMQRDYDQVTEAVTAKLERAQILRCLSSLTELQRESVLLAPTTAAGPTPRSPSSCARRWAPSRPGCGTG
jgi:RNA polymerase sigma-70 factor (ECF subfamily)